MLSSYPNLSALLANSAYGKTPALSDVAIRSTALRLAVDSFDVEMDISIDRIGGRAATFEKYLREGSAGIEARAREIRADDDAVKAKNGRIVDLETALFQIGTAFAAWEKTVRDGDGYFWQDRDLSAANAEFHTTVTRTLSETPMPGESDGFEVRRIGSVAELFDVLGKVFGPMSTPESATTPEPTSEPTLSETLKARVPDCGNPDCLVHKPGGLLDTARMAADVLDDAKPETNE